MMQMRDATKEEQEGIRKYIESISVRMIPITVLEEIKAEIMNWESDLGNADDPYQIGAMDMRHYVLLTIDRHISGKEEKDKQDYCEEELEGLDFVWGGFGNQ